MATETAEAQSPSPEPTNAAKRKALPEIEVDLALPEPPSKRARRALKKGKEPTATKPSRKDRKTENADLADEEEEEDTNDKKTGEEAEAKRSEHAIWIGNLPFEVNTLQLKKWLVENSGGAIENASITRVKLPAGISPRGEKQPNKGFAYVDFDEVTPKVAAMALSETDLGGRKVLIKDATSFEGRPDKPKTDGQDSGPAKNEPASRKIFVGNLSWEANEDLVWAHFAKCGEIQWVKLATFEDSGKCKGYGWVNFKEAQAAAAAVQGFARIKEEIATEEDFAAEEKDGGDDAADEDAEGGGEKKQKFRMRKWWVNRLLRRDLKIELAEDDQTRYKKRFKKGGARPAAGKATPAIAEVGAEA